MTLGAELSRTAIGEINPSLVRPLRDLILVKVLEEEWQSGLIYIPENVRTKSCQGRVLDMGDRCWEDEDGLAPGDHILFTAIQENMWFYEGGEYGLVALGDVITVIEEG